MERESFEDEEVAAYLNEHYVAIKVDREERPDIDHIYMMVCQAMTGQGGWPLTVVMTPEQKPFFAGTYFPKEKRYGRPGLLDILGQIEEKWRTNKGYVNEAGAKILDYMQRAERESSSGAVDEALLHRAFEAYQQDFDPEFGGFGQAPKFPTPHNLIFLLRYGHRFQKPEAIEMARKTLAAMYAGGIYDHVGCGFSRYSTDQAWLVPHFEKMLYDNALLVLAYIEAHQVTADQRYANITRDILAYVLRDMTHSEGGFYSAEDADSEGEEGKFYLWSPQEVKEVLGEVDGTRYCETFDITPRGNFEGMNIPNLIGKSSAELARQAGQTETEWWQGVGTLQQSLFQARERRIHPHKDDKILTAWNGMMIAALARAGKVLQEPKFVAAAERAVQFIRDKLTTPEGRLLARYRDGHAAHLGYVDDYAFFTWGLMELYEATWNVGYLTQAVQLQKDMIDRFWDHDRGGFYFYGDDGEALITRPKEIYDGATPSGNSVAANNLIRLARLTGDPVFDKYASEQFVAFAGDVSRYPAGYSYFLTAMQFALAPTKEVVIAGGLCQEDTQEMLHTVQTTYLPFAVVALHATGEAGQELEALAPFVVNQTPQNDRATAYVCEHFACGSPITDPTQLRDRLSTP